MDLLIVYGRVGGATRRAAEAVAASAAAEGADVTTRFVGDATQDDVSRAGALVAGCGVDVRVPFGGERVGEMADWISRLPPLNGMPAAAFCTYGFFPVMFSDAVARTAETLGDLSRGLEAKGARVVATQTIHRRSHREGAAQLVRRVFQHA